MLTIIYRACKWNFQDRFTFMYLLQAGKFWWLMVNFWRHRWWRLLASKMADMLIWYWIRAIRHPVVLSNYYDWKKQLSTFSLPVYAGGKTSVSDDSVLERKFMDSVFVLATKIGQHFFTLCCWEHSNSADFVMSLVFVIPRSNQLFFCSLLLVRYFNTPYKWSLRI